MKIFHSFSHNPEQSFWKRNPEKSWTILIFVSVLQQVKKTCNFVLQNGFVQEKLRNGTNLFQFPRKHRCTMHFAANGIYAEASFITKFSTNTDPVRHSTWRFRLQMRENLCFEIFFAMNILTSTNFVFKMYISSWTMEFIPFTHTVSWNVHSMSLKVFAWLFKRFTIDIQVSLSLSDWQRCWIILSKIDFRVALSMFIFLLYKIILSKHISKKS